MARPPSSSPTGDRIANQKGDRIAKVLARAGVASRRDAERMIAEGRVRVNGTRIDSPALNVGPGDRISVDGKPLPAPERPRLWLYHKPTGLVTTARDEKGRATIFGSLPPEMAQVNPVGRLDITSEGLILLTNDGALKRRLELPSTGWLRRYRVRINGSVSEASLEKLRGGIVLDDGTRFQAMVVTFDRQQGANAWLTVSLREGKNREIRRAMEAIGVVVNRLIRISYGPFQLGNLGPGEVEEIKPKVMRDQLGLAAPEGPGGRSVRRDADTDRPARAKPGVVGAKRPASSKSAGPKAAGPKAASSRATGPKPATTGPAAKPRAAKPTSPKPDAAAVRRTKPARKPRVSTRNAPAPAGPKGKK